MKIPAAIATLGLVGCGYSFSSKQLTLVDAKGDPTTAYSCGSYMQVTSDGWGHSTFEVTFTDGKGLAHELHGVTGVGVADIPATIDAPMWAFDRDPFPGERYRDKPDGSLGAEIKEGDVAVRGDNQARLLNGKWTPVKITNPACRRP